MKEEKELLLANFDKISTTEMGKSRIKRNLNLDISEDAVIEYSKNLIKKSDSVRISGKNFYVEIDDKVFTINKNSYNIITAHIL